MTDCYLLCNIVNCRKELKSEAWITTCSHIFCMNHGQNAVDKEKCMICDTTFSTKYDIVVMDLNPPEQHKTMVLSGLSPEKVLDIATRSLAFWTYQTYQERLLRDSEIRSAKQHVAEIKDYCEATLAKHKVEVQKLHRQIQCYQKEIAEKSKQMYDCARQLAERSKLVKNLQSQNDSLKRTLANYMRCQENCKSQPHVEYMDQDVKSCNSNYAYSRPNRDERQTSARYSSEMQNKDFVFKPQTSNFSDNCNYQFK